MDLFGFWTHFPPMFSLQSSCGEGEMHLGAVMSWISGDHNSFSAEPVWASCILFGNRR